VIALAVGTLVVWAVQQWIGSRRTPLASAFLATISMVTGPLGMGAQVVTVLAVLMARRTGTVGSTNVTNVDVACVKRKHPWRLMPPGALPGGVPPCHRPGRTRQRGWANLCRTNAGERSRPASVRSGWTPARAPGLQGPAGWAGAAPDRWAWGMQSVIGSIATHPEEASRPAQEGNHVDQHHPHHHRPHSPVRRWRVLLVTPQVRGGAPSAPAEGGGAGSGRRRRP
jgi:hypothetical protein